MWRQMLPGLKMTILLTVLTGLVYPGIVTGLCQLFFKDRANGSLISKDGRVVGSSLIGQNFTRPEYFQPRPSAAGSDGYDAAASSGSNLGPTNRKLVERVTASVEKFRRDNPDFSGPVPADLVTASASGLDPHISPDAALVQASRVAKARGVPAENVKRLIGRLTEPRDLGFLGEPRINVLMLNLRMDREFPWRGR